MMTLAGYLMHTPTLFFQTWVAIDTRPIPAFSFKSTN